MARSTARPAQPLHCRLYGTFSDDFFFEARGVAPTRGSGVATDGIVLIQIIHADSLIVSSVDANALQQNSRAAEVEQCQYYQHQRQKTQRHEVRLEQRLRPAAKALRDGDPQRDWRSGGAGLTD